MKKYAMIIILSLSIINLVGCNSKKSIEKNTIDVPNFIYICDFEKNYIYTYSYYYDENTNIVYIVYKDANYDYMYPYIASNGLPYKFVDGEFVEINN